MEMNEITEFLPEITAIRRDLHAHPELGFQEERTSALVAKELRKLGIEVAEKIGGTGRFGLVPGYVFEHIRALIIGENWGTNGAGCVSNGTAECVICFESRLFH